MEQNSLTQFLPVFNPDAYDWQACMLNIRPLRTTDEHVQWVKQISPSASEALA